MAHQTPQGMELVSGLIREVGNGWKGSTLEWQSNSRHVGTSSRLELFLEAQADPGTDRDVYRPLSFGAVYLIWLGG